LSIFLYYTTVFKPNFNRLEIDSGEPCKVAGEVAGIISIDGVVITYNPPDLKVKVPKKAQVLLVIVILVRFSKNGKMPKMVSRGLDKHI